MTRIICEPLNGKPQRAVTVELSDGRQYSDLIDVRSGFQRQQLLDRVAGMYDLTADDLRPLDAAILREAGLADQRAEGGETKDRFPLVTSAQLAATDYTPRPIITDCLYAGHPHFVGGMFKTGKTLVAVDAAISVSSGRPFLNVFTVPSPLTVVYFSGEGGPSIIKEYGERIAAAKGMALSDASNVYWCFTVPKLESLDDLDAMIKVVSDTGAELVVIDNTTLALSGDDAGNVMKMGRILGTAIKACGERGATPVFVHHFKRARAGQDQFAPGELLDLTQAGAAEVAGQWWLLTRREAYDPDQTGEHRLWLNIGGRLGHGQLHALDVSEGRLSDPGGRRWDVEVRPPDEVRQDAQANQEAARRQRADERRAAELEADRMELVRFATRFARPFTERDIRGHVTAQGIRLKRAIVSLANEGIFQTTEIVKSNNQTYDGWTIRQTLDTTG